MTPRKEKTVYDALKEATNLRTLRKRLLGATRPKKVTRARGRHTQVTKPQVTGSWQGAAFWLTIIIVVTVRLFQLDRLQAEMYGDISIVYKYVLDVKNGIWPFYFSLSVGPLYHYLIMPVIWVAGMNYLGFKLASVVTSLGALVFTYLFTRRLAGSTFAILATLIAGVSSWLLIFSRLGNVPIIVPMLTMAALWLLARYIQDHNRWDLIACAAVSTLGLYTYPQGYFLAPAMAITLLVVHLSGSHIRGKEWLAFFVTCAVCALPFIAMVIEAPIVFTDGYLGQKFQTEGSLFGALINNVTRAFGAYHFSGDHVFRSNPAGRPHLDLLSGILFIIGLVYWLRNPRRLGGLLMLVPFIVLHIPSILAISDSSEVPSAIRTLGVAPIVYVFVASGLWATFDFIRSRWSSRAALAVSGLALLLLTVVNLRIYFADYIKGLPYSNTPIARLITDYIDMLPPDTQVYLSGCCWQSGMPEPLSIEFQMARPENLHLVNPEDLSCNTLNTLYGPAVMVWSFNDPLPSPSLSACAERFPVQLFSSRAGLPAFHAASIQGDLQVITPVTVEGGEPAELLNAEGLLEQALLWGDENVLARYSPLDIGRIEDVVDGKLETLMRGRDANPLIMEFEFAQARSLTSVALTTGSIQHLTVKIVITYLDNSTAEIVEDYENLGPDPTVEIVLPESEDQVLIIRIEITDLGSEPAAGFHIHVREVELMD